MKRIALLLSILCLSLSASFAANDGDHQFIPIRVLDDTVETGTTHRSQEFVPIQAYYDGFTSSIFFTFLQNIGEVEVSISNLYNGDYVDYIVNSSIGATIIPICGDSGIYHITIIVSSGGGYEGEFEID